MERKYQVIVYGATGFTGKLCAKYLKDNYSDLSWAIGGRNLSKLEKIKEDLNLDCDIQVADGENYEELCNLVKQTKVLILTAGRLTLSMVHLLMKACIFERTHYTDITGENHWVKSQMDLSRRSKFKRCE